MRSPCLKIICLTGGLASGKSTAVTHLAAKGALVIDADLLGHRVYEPGTRAFNAVTAAFGDGIVGGDGRIDRRMLGARVFGRPDEMKKLTDIVWPEIRRLAEREIERIRRRDPHAVVVLEAAVLFEAGWDDIGDEVWVLAVDRDLAIRRAMARDGAPREAVEKRLDAQLGNDARSAGADLVITNNGDKAALLAQLDAAWESGTG